METPLLDITGVENFIQLVNKIKYNTSLDSSNHTLKIFCIYTELGSEDLFSKLTERYPNTEIIGDFSKTEINKEDPEKKVTFFTHKDVGESPVAYIFSITRKTLIDNSIDKLVRFLPKTHYLWLRLSEFDELKEIIIDSFEKEDIIIDSFTARRKATYSMDCSLRDNVTDRKLHYEGRDGIESLREMRSIYGVVPEKIGFYVSNVIQFSMDHRNTFIIKKGFPYLNKIFDIISLSLERYSQIDNVLSNVRFKQIQNKPFIDFIINPLRVLFGSSKTPDDINGFFSILESNREEKYCVINPLVVSGSLFFSAMIFDEDKNSIISISGDSNEMTILPHKNCERDSLSRFYEQIDMNLDPNTQIEN